MTTADDGLPATFPFGKVEELLASFGVEARDCLSLTFGLDGVTLERVRTVADGKSIPAGVNVATTTTVIGYDRDH